MNEIDRRMHAELSAAPVNTFKLHFGPHIKYLKDRCLKALNLLRVAAHQDWGADCATLLKLYRSHVRSKFDYGCVVYAVAQSVERASSDP